MKQLYEAIYARWIGPILDVVQLYDTEAPALSQEEGDGGSVFPYAVFSLPSRVANGTFTEDFEDCLIQFVIYSKIAVSGILHAVTLMYDHYDLTIDDYTMISLQREGANRIRHEGVWIYNVSYRVLLQKN